MKQSAYDTLRRPRRWAATLASLAMALAAGTVTVLPSPAMADNPVTPGDFTGYGFDQCLAPTQASMDTWWSYSPFTAVGIYISGDSRACRVQPNLTPTWIATQLATGWRLLPIALGPQASCQPRFPRYKDDFKIDPTIGDGSYPNARAQGAVEATKNANDALALGIAGGSTIWYDLEGFDLTNTNCRESALAFISSWTATMRQIGYVPGMYSSAGSGIKMLDDARLQRPGQFNLPDRIWIARWDGLPNTSTTYITEDGWRPGSRMKQYLGGHDETHGGVKINIDSNWLELGAPPSAAAETWCGGVPVNLPAYPRLNARKPNLGAITALQCLLKTTGLYRGRVAGKFNVRTAKAINSWQAGVGFAPTKFFARKHWIALLSAGTTPLLKVGMSGADVHRLQRSLIATGQTGVTVSGVFDLATETALKAYAAKVGAPATGTTLPATWLALQTGKR